MRFLNLFRHKPEQTKKETFDISKLENHFILHVGVMHCDICRKETVNCCKIDIADQCVCICPRKDIKGIHFVKKLTK